MFALHETTQRRICRVGFLVLCALPVLLTLAAVVYCNRPWRQADWQQTLVEQLHVRAEVEQVSRPRPGTVVLTKLQLADLRSGLELGTFDELRLQTVDSRLQLHVGQLSVEAEQLPALVTMLATWLETHEALPLDFYADRLTIHSPSRQDLQLVNFVVSSVGPDPQRQIFRCTAEDAAGEKVQLVLASELQILRCSLDTKQSPLPAWLIGKFVPGVAGCGEAKFGGVITAGSEGQNSRGKLTGTFEHIDLQAWVGQDCPHHLQGDAQVVFEQLTWANGRIEIAEGSLEAGSGGSSFSLLENAHKLCGCEKGPTFDSLRPTTESVVANKLVRFDKMSFHFDMNQAGIRIVGTAAQGAILSVGKTPLLFARRSEQMPLPVGLLVVLLDYQQLGWMPATRRAHAMAEKLPLPSGAVLEPEVLQR